MSNATLHIALVANSDCDRTDIIYIGDDEAVAVERLRAVYNKYLDEFEDEIDVDNSPAYKTLSDFKQAVTDDSNSAYIQCFDKHINFELHACDPAVINNR